jgi:hypothetical protein
MTETVDPIIEETLHKLAPLLGVWTGTGKGEFPTIDGFTYRETFRVRRDEGASLLAYQQSTDLIDADGQPYEVSHFETGIIRPLEDGRVEVACVHNGGRVEVLHGGFEPGSVAPDAFTLRLGSEVLANDERMKNSSREWVCRDGRLQYRMRMLTTDVGEMTLHLTGNLSRS